MNSVEYADVTVIIPCYRCADTIGRAVASVFSQTCRPRELILVEDCSADNTAGILHQIQGDYPRGWIRVIFLARNFGPGGARNAGWDAAKTTYIAFLDADDSWHPRKLEVQYRWMLATPTAALTAHDREVIERSDSAIAHQIVSSEELSFRRITKLSLLLGNRFSTPTVMLLREIEQRFAVGKYFSEDYLLWCEIVCQGGLVYKLDVSLAYLYKAPYGAGGLSGQLLEMQRGQLDTYKRLCNGGYVSFLFYWFLVIWSVAKFFRRLLLVKK